MKTFYRFIVLNLYILFFIILIQNVGFSQEQNIIDVSGFNDSAHHWRDITDSEQVFLPNQNQKRYDPSQIKNIFTKKYNL